MGDFLPPAALKVIAEDYQQGLLDRLNEQIKGARLSHHVEFKVLTNVWTGTKLENQSVASIVISIALDESQSLAFNSASLALNNSFFCTTSYVFSLPPKKQRSHLYKNH
jgi:Fe-Mn family superoxide dismutase